MINNYQKIIKDIKKIAWEKLKSESTGHDFWHLKRVAQNAVLIGNKEGGDLEILGLSGWLHDIAAGHDKDHEIKSVEFTKKLLTKYKVNNETIRRVTDCIKNHRFSKGIKPKTLEEKIIQDADKLDALGAIGLARLFILGGKYGQMLYDPEVKPDFDYYLKHGRSNTTINHFSDKLFKLKNLMYTKTARKIAVEREKYMRDYLKQFFSEWEVK